MTATLKGRRAALGIRCHSGWAAAIVVARTGTSVEVIDRRRIELCDSSIYGSKQPFHAAEAMPFPEAQAFVERCRVSTEALAALAVESLVSALASRRLQLTGCGVLWASGRPLPPLREILQSHALILAAEGLFYRDAVATSCEAAGISATRIRESEALRQASDRTKLPEATIGDRLASIGRTLGPPWTADQKLATLAALIVLP